VIPFVDISIKLIVLWLLLVLEEQVPEFWGFTSLLNDLNLIRSSFILFQQGDVSICLIHVWSYVSIWHVASLPNEDRSVSFIFVARLDDEHGSWV
jgi:hypothetical protein